MHQVDAGRRVAQQLHKFHRPRQSGTKYSFAVNGEGVPVACTTTAANVNDTVLFERLFLAAFAVMAYIDFVHRPRLRCQEQTRRLPQLRRLVVHSQTASAERIRARAATLVGGAQQCLDAGEQALGLRYVLLGFIVQALLQTTCILLVAGRLVHNF